MSIPGRRRGGSPAAPARQTGRVRRVATNLTSPAKSATRLPRLFLVGQTGRMMTEAEALQTLAREDPAVADDAKAALRWLTSGGGLETISLLRLTAFLWFVLPTSWPVQASGHMAVARALARLLTLAGMERYGDVCASAETEQIIEAYARAHDDGMAAHSKALAASHAAPPD